MTHTLQKQSIAEEETSEALNKAERIIWTWCIILTAIFIFGWPLLALPAGVFPKVSVGTTYLSIMLHSVLSATCIDEHTRTPAAAAAAVAVAVAVAAAAQSLLARQCSRSDCIAAAACHSLSCSMSCITAGGTLTNVLMYLSCRVT